MIHSADRYALTTSDDMLMDDVEALGSKEAVLTCRFIPITTADRERYAIDREADAYKVLFDVDPSLTNAKVLVWTSKVWRIREVIDSGGIGWVWHAIVEHVPQVEIGAP